MPGQMRSVIVMIVQRLSTAKIIGELASVARQQNGIVANRAETTIDGIEIAEGRERRQRVGAWTVRRRIVLDAGIERFLGESGVPRFIVVGERGFQKEIQPLAGITREQDIDDVAIVGLIAFGAPRCNVLEVALVL